MYSIKKIKIYMDYSCKSCLAICLYVLSDSIQLMSICRMVTCYPISHFCFSVSRLCALQLSLLLCFSIRSSCNLSFFVQFNMSGLAPLCPKSNCFEIFINFSLCSLAFVINWLLNSAFYACSFEFILIVSTASILCLFSIRPCKSIRSLRNSPFFSVFFIDCFFIISNSC